MVWQPGDYVWSSFRHHAYGERDALVDPHAVYQRLGRDDAARRGVYRALFESELPMGITEAIRAAVAFSTPLGDQRFKERVERDLGRQIGQATRGRPPRRAPIGRE
jgi:putative transposase